MEKHQRGNLMINHKERRMVKDNEDFNINNEVKNIGTQGVQELFF